MHEIWKNRIKKWKTGGIEKLFPHAEPGKDAGDDLVPGGAACQLAQSVQGLLRVGEHRVRGQAGLQGPFGAADGVSRPAGGLLLPLVRQQAARVAGLSGGVEPRRGPRS